jgi:hypothetical protein
MNLWAKSLRQLCFAVALFFFSCEDENTFLGPPADRNNRKFDVAFVEIPLTSSMVVINSVPTDNKTGAGIAQVGQYTDPVLGAVKATSFLHINPTAASVIPETAIFDSVTVQLRLNFYAYGFDGERTHTFTIHELNDSLDRRATSRYNFNDAVAYNPTEMASASFKVRYDTLRKNLGLPSNAQDTITAQARLSDAFGQRIFDLAKAYPFSGSNTELVSSQFREFNERVKGLAIVPISNEGILGLRLDGFSRVTIHYRATNTSGNLDTLARSYLFGSPSFTNITAERTGTEVGGLPAFQNTPPSTFGLRIVQSGSPVVTRLDLENFYRFTDTVGTVIVNEAELILGSSQSLKGLEPHSSLAMKVMRSTNQFYDAVIPADSAALTGYRYLTLEQVGPESFHAFVASDQSSDRNPLRAGIGYDSDPGSFAGYMTFFAQSLIKESNRNGAVNPERIPHLALFPSSPSAAFSVNRTLLDASQIKLRIYYTKPKLNL